MEQQRSLKIDICVNACSEEARPLMAGKKLMIWIDLLGNCSATKVEYMVMGSTAHPCFHVFRPDRRFCVGDVSKFYIAISDKNE